MRSKLFVPGARPELFPKAFASAADAVSIDLEDAVSEDNKSAARAHVVAFLGSDAAAGSGKVVIVRVNAAMSPHFEADLELARHARVALINLPKVESPEDVEAAAARIGGAPKILANIETAAGVQRAAEIAAHPCVVGLQVGYVDLFESLGADRRDAANVHAVMFAVRIAAACSGKFAYDGAFPDVHDAAGFRAEALMARKLGFLGKSCIHPSQTPIANEVFAPNDAELAQAERVLQAARTRAGAFLLDGRMIDAPAIRRAEALLAAYGDRRIAR